jgi:hypothetical protein
MIRFYLISGLLVFLGTSQNILADEWNRVYLVSFPRSGNHWVRFLVEEATHITTSSIYRDSDFPHLPTRFPSGGYSVDHGYQGNCRFPEPKDPVLIKTHYPFLTQDPIDPSQGRSICLIQGDLTKIF